MLNPIVKEYFETFNTIEKKQLEMGKFVFDYPLSAIHNNGNNFTFDRNYFLKNNSVFVCKHNRFAAYPLHNHDFFEFNFMLRGSSSQVINGESVILQTGDLILLNTNCYQSIEPLSENDILINIIFPYEHLDSMWVSELSSENNSLFNFLMQEVSDYAEGNYILFPTSNNADVQLILYQIINKYYTDNCFSKEILRHLITILFMELVGNVPYKLKYNQKDQAENYIVSNCLKLISKQYSELSLDKASKILHYNKCYLSSLITKKTGLTFTDHLNDKRIKEAALLIKNTQLTIREISERVGIGNKNYFYNLFKEKYGILPSKYRTK